MCVAGLCVQAWWYSYTSSHTVQHFWVGAPCYMLLGCLGCGDRPCLSVGTTTLLADSALKKTLEGQGSEREASTKVLSLLYKELATAEVISEPLCQCGII